MNLLLYVLLSIQTKKIFHLYISSFQIKAINHIITSWYVLFNRFIFKCLLKPSKLYEYTNKYLNYFFVL